MSLIAPYRADHVGSLLRPQAIKDARKANEEGSLDDADLRAVEDECISEVVKHQEAAGLQCVTDGEYRRTWWHFDFLGGLDGVEILDSGASIPFQGAKTRHENVFITGKLGYSGHYMLEHFKFLKSVTSVTPKMTIPAPSVLHFRPGRQNISKEVYPDLDHFFADTAEVYRKVVKAFYEAGCRYLQFDDTVWAYLCSEAEKERCRERGDDPESLPAIYRDIINFAIQDKPDDMIITTHVCRGNFRSTWISEGGYEPIAEIMLNDTHYDGYFLEYDSERAGGFEPLRFLPKGNKRVVLGLITSKSGELENRGNIMRRVEEACAFAPLDQLCLSPQCGFASTEEGNILTEQQQWDKLQFIAELAREIWRNL